MDINNIRARNEKRCWMRINEGHSNFWKLLLLLLLGYCLGAGQSPSITQPTPRIISKCKYREKKRKNLFPHCGIWVWPRSFKAFLILKKGGDSKYLLSHPLTSDTKPQSIQPARSDKCLDCKSPNPSSHVRWPITLRFRVLTLNF